jgi:hypothetical protein
MFNLFDRNRKFELLEVIQGTWCMLPRHNYEQFHYEQTMHCRYEIIRYLDNNEIEMQVFGHNPKNHRMYLVAFDKFKKYQEEWKKSI